MAEKIIMPKLGFNMSKGKLVKWHKSEGDSVEKGEVFFEITTDKTNIDIEATSTGIVLKIIAEEGDEYDVFTPIAIVGEADEDIEALLEELDDGNDKEPATEEKVEEVAEEKSEKKTKEVKVSTGDVKFTPRARKYMEDNDIDPADIDLVEGTGFEGGINEKDVMEYAKKNAVRISPVARNLAKLNNIDIKTVTGTGAMGKIMKEDIENAIARESESVAEAAVASAGSDSKRVLEKVPYSGVRKIIGDRLAESKFTAPHLYFKKSVDMTEVLAFRKTVNAKQDHKTSVTDYITMAASKALQKYPDINSALIGDEIIKYESANVGIAVAADSGLIVPVVKNTQDKSLVTVSKEFKDLVVKARDGKLHPTDYADGTFTISNLGMFGIEEFTAIINPPESAILSVSATFDKAVVVKVDGEKLIEIRPVMNIVLSVDHRIIDGLLAAQFVGEVQRLLENPFELVL